MLAYNLGKKGYQILTAYNGFEAWEKIELERPDLLILDLMMPDLDGWELCRLVRRSQTKEIKEMGILMLTARAMPEDRVYGLEIGADDYLTKPFSLNELTLRVEKLTERKKSVYQLREEMEFLQSSIQKKETDLKRVVHDLKNPLVSIGASAKRMLRRNQNEEELKILRMIYDNSLRLTRWVDDTLSFKKMEDELKEVDIRPLIQQVINLQKEGSVKKMIEIDFEATSSIPLIRCHEQLIFRVIENLLNNALKYTPEGGRVNVMITPHVQCEDEGTVEISVKDTGIGIPKEDIGKIFEPFYRGNNAPKETGTGLGLAFVKQAVDLHGGRIWVQSELEKGSTFSVRLPVGRRVPNHCSP
jgi:signal transduction histidine kinase